MARQRVTAADYVDPAQQGQVDPYLAWAAATEFAGFRREGDPVPERVRVLVEMHEGHCIGELAEPRHGRVDVTPASRDWRHGTAWFGPQDCRRWAAPNDLVRRFELTMPVLPRRSLRRRPGPAAEATARKPVKCTDTTLLAVIDDGCPFAHASLRGPAGLRVLSLWDQDPLPAFGTAELPGAVPAQLGYGREVVRDELQRLLDRCTPSGRLDEDRVYEAARMPELRRVASHGAFVLDQFVGPRRLGDRLALQPDEPPSWRRGGAEPSDTADLVFVQLPRDAWADPNALALPACVVDGLHHVLDCCSSSVKRVVVNLSCAIHTGPHDGSSLLDGALAELVQRQQAEHQRELVIVVPSGNAFLSRWHAAGAVKAGTPGRLCLRVPPGCEAPSFLQLWVPGAARGLRWHVQAPGAPAPQPVPDGAGLRIAGSRGVLATAQRCTGTARGGDAAAPGNLLLLALSAADLPDQPGAGGDWQITVEVGHGSPTVAVQAFVARNQSELGAPLRHRPAWLVEAAFDPERYLREREDDLLDEVAQGPPAPRGLQVRRRGSGSAIAEGPAVVVAAGAMLRPALEPARYASDCAAVDRCAAAFSDESRALPGIRGAGTRSGSVLRLQGTSFAAPQLARAFADQPLASAPPPSASRGGGAAPPSSPAPLPPPPRDVALTTVPAQHADRLGRVLVTPRRRPQPASNARSR